ncbi:hypothetical protein D3C81_1646850 [compost metagenome]
MPAHRLRLARCGLEDKAGALCAHFDAGGLAGGMGAIGYGGQFVASRIDHQRLRRCAEHHRRGRLGKAGPAAQAVQAGGRRRRLLPQGIAQRKTP